jgi:hypothetical protein
LAELDDTHEKVLAMRRKLVKMRYALDHTHLVLQDTQTEGVLTLKILESKGSELEHTYDTITELRKQLRMLHYRLTLAIRGEAVADRHVLVLEHQLQAAEARLESQEDDVRCYVGVGATRPCHLFCS